MNELAGEEYWNAVSERFALLKEYDKGCQLVFGSNYHQYSLEPVATESMIVEFENRLKVSLHPYYRNYLKYFSSGGAGPGYEMDKFSKKVSTHTRLLKPLMLEPFNQDSVPANWEKKTESLKRSDGLISIGTTGNPTIIYFVQTGDYAGNVIIVSEDLVSFHGAFHEWYSNWIETSIKEINNLHFLERIEIGMGYDELISVVSLPHYMLDVDIVHFNGIPVYFFLDTSRKINKIQMLKCGRP